MKKLLSIGLVLAFATQAFAADAWFPEGIQVKSSSTIGAKQAADSKAVLDIISTTKGLLPPRMTTAQRTAISSPSEGLVVFDTDINSLYQYTGAAWLQVATVTGTETLTNKTISGSDNTITNVSLSTGVTGSLPIANGGTGQGSKAAAFDALSPMTTGGDLIYGGASGTGTRLANGSSGQFLKSNGGTAAPSWASPSIVSIAPVIQRLTASSGTWNMPYVFTISSGSATVGATYTNNSITFTVLETVASATQVVMTGSGAPTSSGTLTKASGTGDSTLTFSVSYTPVYIEVETQGAGGGGGGSGTATPGAGGSGGNSTFGSSITANGGSGGAWAHQSGGTGGSYTAPDFGYGISGGYGGGSTGTGSEFYWPGGTGGTSGCGGAGGGGNSQAGREGSGGAGATTAGAGGPGSGGGGGGCVRAFIRAPAATISYTTGTGGAGGTAGGGAGAAVGGAGGDGYHIVRSHYQ